MSLKFILGIALAGLLVVSGCAQVQQKNDATQKTGEAMEKQAGGEQAMVGKEGQAMQGSEGQLNQGKAMVKSTFEPFTKEKYEAAKASGKTIFLEFYANWCPICASQKPKLEQGFGELKNQSLVGFQVNYKDNETDADELALARKFGITYQHTHVLIDSGENVLLRSSESWSKEDVVQKLGSFGG
ncbi:MAG: thioredoxin family protein [Bacteroidota bacterium]